MQLLCHRCGDTLAGDASFCPQCGAPQLRFTPQESAPASSTNQLADGTDVPAGIERTDIQWKSVIRIAASVSLVVGLLSSIFALGSLLWVMGGAVLVIALYHRRVPYAVLQPSLGARIGVVTGTMTAAMAIAINTVLLVVQRYGLHQGNLLDASLNSTVQQAIQRASTSSDAQAQVTTTLAFLLSPEGKAGMVLAGMACIALMILLLSIAGGVLGAQLYRNRRNVQPGV